jgi:putative hydrolase of the HAD superfamily
MSRARKPGPMVRPEQVACWVFDLDNTLYPADCNLFAQIDFRMTEYISALLSVDKPAARQLQKTYYFQYGTTLRGLMLHHAVDPEDYLSFVHDIDVSPVPPSPRLDRALALLPGRKVVFTNGSAAHAGRVMNRLGVSGHFDRVFDIEAVGFVPKPHPDPYDHLIGELGIPGHSMVLFEDTHSNLAPAAERGMTTVWVRHPESKMTPDRDDVAHHVTDDLVGWLSALVDAPTDHD